MKINKFTELGVNAFAGVIGKNIALSIAENYSLIDANSNILTSPISFGIATTGISVGILISILAISYLKNKENNNHNMVTSKPKF